MAEAVDDAVGVRARELDTLVVMALAAESAQVFEQAGVPVLYCGVGKINAAVALSRELARYTARGATLPRVINFGTAGSHRHPTGTFLACDAFVQRDMDASALGFEVGVTPFDAAPACLQFTALFPQLPRAVCGSGDSFAVEPPSLPCDALDMEAYALAKVCWSQRTPFGCVKYVTDGADLDAAANWQANVHRAAEGFLALYRTLVVETGSPAPRQREP